MPAPGQPMSGQPMPVPTMPAPSQPMPGQPMPPPVPGQGHAAPAAAASGNPVAEGSAASRRSRGTEADSDGEEIILSDLLIEVLERGASDLHLTAGAPPTLRLNGHLHPMDDRPILTPPVIQKMM
ncbi:MAG: twitching motility protein PilT, partial [Frankiaceae bacterium]|nr:twitching motility protein PilT [Frankiaceae bacterium]